MNINHIYNPIYVSFKAKLEKPEGTEKNAVSNPIATNSKNMAPLPSSIVNSPDFNIKVPQKYSYLGEINLPMDTKAYQYKMENGQRVVIIPKKGPTIVKSYFNVGSMNEPDDKRGISHFIEHNLFNGSEGLNAGEFFETVNKIGASTNASTSFAATDYYIQSNLLKKNDLETKIKIHASMLETPKFSQNMIEKEKGPVTSEINMILDDPANIATNYTLKSLFNINSTSTDVIGGTVNNINKLTRNDVVDYYKKNYFPHNMVTVITGEVTPDETIGLISKYFHSTNTNPPARNYEKLNPIQNSVRNDIISDKTNSAIVSMGFVGPKNNSTKDKILLDAFQFFLVGSSVARLNKSLEEIQTNAFISSDRISTKPNDNTVILFSTETSDSNAENAINKVFYEINDLEKNPPTQKELNIVKKKLKLNLAQVFESSSIINSVVGTAMLDNDIKAVTDFEKVIDNLTSEDIVNFSRKYFDLNKVAITVVHPKPQQTQKKGFLTNLSFRGKVAENNHKEAIDETKINKFITKDNLEVVINNIDKNLSTFDLSLSTTVPANTKPGVSKILALLLNKGSKNQDEKKFFSDLENHGIQSSFDASLNEIRVKSMFLPQDSIRAIQSAKEVIYQPRFTQADLNAAKTFLREISQNIPKSSTEGMLSHLFEGQPYGQTNQDLLNNIDGITLQDVQNLYNYILTNAEGRIVFSGPFEKQPDLKNAVFNELNLKNLKPTSDDLFNSYIPVPYNKVALQAHNKSQAEIQMGYKFKTNNNMKDSITVELLNTILGGTPSSRLFSDLREKQKLAYQVNSRLNYYDNSGVISMFIKTTTDDNQTGQKNYENVQKSINGFKNHVEKLKNSKVSDLELENAKLTLKNKILNYSEMTADKNVSILLGEKTPYGYNADNKELEMIDKITPEDIYNAANYIFNTNSVVSLVATKDTILNNENYLKSLGQIVE